MKMFLDWQDYADAYANKYIEIREKIRGLDIDNKQKVCGILGLDVQEFIKHPVYISNYHPVPLSTEIFGLIQEGIGAFYEKEKC